MLQFFSDNSRNFYIRVSFAKTGIKRKILVSFDDLLGKNIEMHFIDYNKIIVELIFSSHSFIWRRG